MKDFQEELKRRLEDAEKDLKRAEQRFIELQLLSIYFENWINKNKGE